jgi:hypothetical protein
MRNVLIPLLALFVALLLYVGSYLLLVEASPLSFMSGIGPWPRVPDYRVGGKAAEVFFEPIQQIDERVRPQYWRFP